MGALTEMLSVQAFSFFFFLLFLIVDFRKINMVSF